VNRAYYNENDPDAAAWLRELIRRGLIADGDVDDRSIEDVGADDIAGYSQHHFFAGIGGWSYALRLAGWPDDRPVWTGSCPCQPFSVAGKRAGTDDYRHLWPEFARLISECRPSVVFGEQVASPDGREWLAGVRADLEGMDYAVGAADMCAAGVGAPHIRQRLYWMAIAHGNERGGERLHVQSRATRQGSADTDRRSAAGRVGHTVCARLEGHAGNVGNGRESGRQPEDPTGPVAPAGGRSNAWSRYVIACDDAGDARRIEPGLVPLAHGIPARVVRVRGYGNAIVPQVAAAFIKAGSGWIA